MRCFHVETVYPRGSLSTNMPQPLKSLNFTKKISRKPRKMALNIPDSVISSSLQNPPFFADKTHMLKVANLLKTFKKSNAVDHLSFEVMPGEVLGLLGPNGAGKTTTLRAIAGVMSFDKGEIAIDNHSIVNSAIEAKRRMAYLPDQSTFFDNLTCWEHVRFVASVYKVEDYENKGRALFDRLELTEKINEFPSELSKGMRQRLGLICALLHSPKLLLLDEPMTGLDPKGIRTVHEIIKEISAAGGSVILSSHLLSILEEVCTKVLVMDHGKSKLYGTVEEIRSKVRELGKHASLEDMFFHATKDAA